MSSKHFGAAAAPPRTRHVYSIDDVIKLVGLGRTFIYEQIKEGRLTVRKAGRRTLVFDEDLEAWLRALPTKAST